MDILSNVPESGPQGQGDKRRVWWWWWRAESYLKLLFFSQTFPGFSPFHGDPCGVSICVGAGPASNSQDKLAGGVLLHDTSPARLAKEPLGTGLMGIVAGVLIGQHAMPTQPDQICRGRIYRAEQRHFFAILAFQWVSYELMCNLSWPKKGSMFTGVARGVWGGYFFLGGCSFQWWLDISWRSLV